MPNAVALAKGFFKAQGADVGRGIHLGREAGFADQGKEDKMIMALTLLLVVIAVAESAMLLAVDRRLLRYAL